MLFTSDVCGYEDIYKARDSRTLVSSAITASHSAGRPRSGVIRGGSYSAVKKPNSDHDYDAKLTELSC